MVITRLINLVNFVVERLRVIKAKTAEQASLSYDLVNKVEAICWNLTRSQVFYWIGLIVDQRIGNTFTQQFLLFLNDALSDSVLHAVDTDVLFVDDCVV